ncbi:hypothetical protein PSPO01_06656 [Paraphaeosphaeria sporulosa]
MERLQPFLVRGTGESFAAEQRRSYRTYVKQLCSDNPYLRNLAQFLSESKPPSNSRICSIDFYEGVSRPKVRANIDTEQLSAEIGKERAEDINDSKCESGHVQHQRPLQGRIVVVEDLSRDIVELLGASLDIDPLFFALHLRAIDRGVSRQQKPHEATLPSRLLPQGFFNISYHRLLMSDENVLPIGPGGTFLHDLNITRELVILGSANIGLSQHCASVIRVKKRDRPWLALILVDPPISSVYTSNDAERRRFRLDLRNYLGTHDNSVEPRPFSEWQDEDAETSSVAQRGMFDDLQQYWNRERPPSFNSSDPSIQSLSYHMLRVVAAEWVRYIAAMQKCLKQYEHSHDQLPATSLGIYDRDLHELMGWRRRTLSSQSKIKSVLRFLAADQKTGEQQNYDLKYLSEDFEHIQERISAIGQHLESTIPVIMSFVQIVDARRAFAETTNMSRLTVLALVFVPLTFVSSLFSMNTENLPGSRGFWVYFAVAIPLTGLVVLVARPPPVVAALVMRVSQWIRKLERGVEYDA